MQGLYKAHSRLDGTRRVSRGRGDAAGSIDLILLTTPILNRASTCNIRAGKSRVSQKRGQRLLRLTSLPVLPLGTARTIRLPGATCLHLPKANRSCPASRREQRPWERKRIGPGCQQRRGSPHEKPLLCFAIAISRPLRCCFELACRNTDSSGRRMMAMAFRCVGYRTVQVP